VEIGAVVDDHSLWKFCYFGTAALRILQPTLLLLLLHYSYNSGQWQAQGRHGGGVQ